MWDMSLFFSTFTLLLWLFPLACKQRSTFHTLGSLVARKEESKPISCTPGLVPVYCKWTEHAAEDNTTKQTKTLPILCIFTA